MGSLGVEIGERYNFVKSTRPLRDRRQKDSKLGTGLNDAPQ